MGRGFSKGAGRPPEGFSGSGAKASSGASPREIKAVRLWPWAAILGCVLARVRNRQISEGTRRERLQVPQEGPSEPRAFGREGGPAPGLRQPGRARHQGRGGGGHHLNENAQRCAAPALPPNGLGPTPIRRPLWPVTGRGQNMVEGVAQQFSVIRRLHKQTLQSGGAGENAGSPSRSILSSLIFIRTDDTAGGANQAVGAPCGLCLGGWRTVLWYQGRSRVVPDWYQGGKGARTAILSIANTYASRPQATPMRPPGYVQTRRRCRLPSEYLAYSWRTASVYL